MKLTIEGLTIRDTEDDNAIVAIVNPSGHMSVADGERMTRLLSAAPELLEELRNIAEAKPSTWHDPSDFKAWAQNRARFAIANATQPH